MTNLRRLLISLGLPFICLSSANAQNPAQNAQTQDQPFKFGDLTVQAGVRVWGNEWDVPVFQITPTLSNDITIQETTRRSNFKFAAIPVLGVSYGRFVSNLTYMAPTYYDAGVEGLSSIRREEFDANFGYSILPPAESVLVGTISYKYAKIDSTTAIIGFHGQPTTINGVLFGLTGSVPIYEKLRLVGSFAIGPAKQRTSTPQGEDRNDGLYRVLELGFSYPLISDPTGYLHSLSLTVTYRAQLYTAKGVQFPTININNQIIGTENRDVNTTTQGPVIGLIGSF